MNIAATFTRGDASGAKGAAFSISDTIVAGDLHLSNVYLTLEKPPGEGAALTVNGQITVGRNNPQTGVVSLRFDAQGVSLVPGRSTVVTIAGIDAAVTSFHCAYDTNSLGLSNCAAKVALAVPALGGTIVGDLDPTNRITFSGSTDVELTNGYRVRLSGASVSLPNKTTGIVLAADTATVSGGMLGDGVTINKFGLASGVVCGSVVPNAIIAAGPFQLSNIQVNLEPRGCARSDALVAPAKPPPASTIFGVSVTTDASLKYGQASSADSAADYVSVSLKQLGLDIPFDGSRINVTVPRSVSVTGSLFGRSVVGVCPAALKQTAGTSAQAPGSLPLIVAGVSTVSNMDVDPNQSGQVFRILDDGTYSICAGLHLTPGAHVATTSDLVDAQLVFALASSQTPTASTTTQNLRTGGYAPPIDFRSARVSYSGTALTTKIGTRSVTIKSLDLSYSADQTDWHPSDYAVANKIPLDCVARLSGKMALSLQGISAVGNVGGGPNAPDGADSLLNTELGIGKACMFADLYGRVTIPIASNSSMVVKEVHFATGPRKADTETQAEVASTAVPASISLTPKPMPVWYSKVNVEIYAGQGGIALHDAGLEEYDGKVRVSGGADYGRTAQMNAGWIVNGLVGLLTGLVIHKL